MQSAVDEVIETMDDYYLTKEEWDTIVELGLDQNKDEAVLKKISTATKTNLTRKYVSHYFLLTGNIFLTIDFFQVQCK